MAKITYVGGGNFTKHALPSGYTQVEYLRSTGTQRIATDIAYSTSNKYVIEAECCWVGSTEGYCGWNAGGIFGNSGGKWHNGSVASSLSATVWTKIRLTIEAGASSNATLELTQGNTTETISRAHPSLATYAQINLPIFAYSSNAGGIEGYAYMMCKYHKVYVNGVLKSDMVTCKNSGGTLGMYNMITGKFHTNAGSGVFTAGPVYAEGVAREVTSKHGGVSAVARKLSIGYAGAGGVARQFWGVSGTPIGNYSVGSSVYIKVNGVSKEFLIVHQGLPSSVYDSSCNGTWLLMKDCYTAMKFDSELYNDYASSDVCAYLNGTFLNYIDGNIRSGIKQVKIPYTKGPGSTGTLATGANGLSTKVFLLSTAEVGFYSDLWHKEGVQLKYFANGNSAVAYYNGSTSNWLVRTPELGSNFYATVIRYDGIAGSQGANSATRGVRPALILPTSALVDGSRNVIAA